MKQTYSSIFSIAVCVVFSKAALPALQIPEGFWSDLFSWLGSPLLSFLAVQMLRKMVKLLNLDQRASKVAKEIWQSWVGHLARSVGSSFISDVAESIRLSGPDSASSSTAELQRSLKELQTRVLQLSPGSFFSSLLSKLETSIDHELQKGFSRE